MIDVRKLQIGDWFKVGENQFYQVDEIRFECGGYRIYMKGTSAFATGDEIDLIDLTDDIMEINGFTRRNVAVGDGHFWVRCFGEKTVSVFLHEFNGQFYAFDYWITQPFDVNNSQALFCTVWRNDPNGLMIVKKPVRNMDAGDAHGIHLLQHAMFEADIEFDWIIK